MTEQVYIFNGQPDDKQTNNSAPHDSKLSLSSVCSYFLHECKIYLPGLFLNIWDGVTLSTELLPIVVPPSCTAFRPQDTNTHPVFPAFTPTTIYLGVKILLLCWDLFKHFEPDSAVLTPTPPPHTHTHILFSI